MPRKIELISRCPGLRIPTRQLRLSLLNFDSQSRYPLPPGTLSVAFIDREECSEMHTRFFGDPSVTDVMTFPGDPDEMHCGDIAVCPPHALEAASQYANDFSSELLLYIVHGCLHLAGLNDTTPAQSRQMRKAEQFILQHLQSHCPTPSFSWK